MLFVLIFSAVKVTTAGKAFIRYKTIRVQGRSVAKHSEMLRNLVPNYTYGALLYMVQVCKLKVF